ncbi:hypothetical protein [Limnobaculum xujianqingii]|uniref:hypothetical protein n=1 Tax=Limnobaculum xujianqingii TaxID=2738837 RepID=UPI0015B9FBDC|nr:hypothetical protein [Limnobaculum xujianqingii]
MMLIECNGEVQDEQARELEELKSAVEGGINSGEDIPAEEVFRKLSDKYRKMAIIAQ